MRVRLDQLVVQRGLAETRERAQSLIMAGAVLVDGVAARRPAQPVEATADVALERAGPEYVSRGALKLERAIDRWQIDPTGWVALDVGASTGGFTDLLLKRGAIRVYAVDVGYGQLHYRLRSDPRVVSMERTNARNLVELPPPPDQREPSAPHESCESHEPSVPHESSESREPSVEHGPAVSPPAPDLAVVDVSFISLRLILPPVFGLIRPSAPVVALIKPQFEAGRQHVHKGGVVRDAAVHRQVLADLVEWSSSQPWRIVDLIASPITGPAGNVEFLSRWARGGQPASRETIQQALSEAAIISAGC
jgi:23S rRNA (cytidine1920-2'-O)/16S rRNA (cytidine1409-2'-O)-methyltransferase